MNCVAGVNSNISRGRERRWSENDLGMFSAHLAPELSNFNIRD